MKRTLFTAAVLTGLITGCNQNQKKTEANTHWNEARASVLMSLGKNQLESGDFDKCRQTLNQAMALSPDSAKLHVLMGKLDIESGQLEGAESELAVAAKIDPKSAEVDYLQGVVYQRWQKPQQALDAYTRASNKDDSEFAYLLARSEMLVSLDQPAEAVAMLQAATPRFEHNAVLHHTLGQLLMDQSKFAAAIVELRQAARLGPDDAAIREHLALALYFNHDYREAEDSLQRLTQDTAAKRADIWIALGECQMQTGVPRDARDSFDMASQVQPESAAAWLSLAKACLALGDGRRADIVVHKALELDMSNPEPHVLLGFLRLRQDRLAEARSEFEKASALDKNDSLSICMIGYVIQKSGQPESAIKYYAEALKLKPTDQLASKLLAAVDNR